MPLRSSVSWLTRRTRDVGSSLQPLYDNRCGTCSALDRLSRDRARMRLNRVFVVDLPFRLDVVEPGHRDDVPLGVGIQRFDR